MYNIYPVVDSRLHCASVFFHIVFNACLYFPCLVLRAILVHIMCYLFKYKLLFTEQDYRTPHVQDQDYRVPVDIAQQLKLPPPPPPPSSKSPLKKPCNHDNVESIDMELSDDENSSAAVPIQTLATSINNTSSSSNSSNSSVHHSIVNSSPLTTDSAVNNNNRRHRVYGNKKIPTLVRHSPQDILEPPPPIPENLCETDGDVRDTVRQGKNQDVIIIDEDGPPHHSHMSDMLIPQLCEMNPASWAGGEEWFDGRPPDFAGDRPFPGGFRHKGEFRGPYRSRGRFADHADFRGRVPRTRAGGMRTRSPRGGFNRGRGGFRGQFRGGTF